MTSLTYIDLSSYAEMLYSELIDLPMLYPWLRPKV